MDGQIDSSNGPCRGEIIGLTAAEAKSGAGTVIHTGN